MKKIILMLSLGFFLLNSGCYNGIAIQTDADKSVKLRDFSTYSLQSNMLEKPDDPLYENELNNRRIREAIQKFMTNRNYQMVDADPDITIQYSFRVENKLRQDIPNWSSPLLIRQSYDRLLNIG